MFSDEDEDRLGRKTVKEDRVQVVSSSRWCPRSRLSYTYSDRDPGVTIRKEFDAELREMGRSD